MMKSLVKVRKSSKYRKLSIIAVLTRMILFIPLLVIGVVWLLYLLETDSYWSDSIAQIWLGIIVGALVGIIWHELAHATSCIAFGGKVYEFGVMMNGFPAAYTKMSTYKIKSRIQLIIVDLSGVQANFMLASICFAACRFFSNLASLCFMMGITNLELALLNLLLIEGLDGCNAVEVILGVDDIFSTCELRRAFYKLKSYYTKDISETEKAQVGISYVFGATKILFPLIILFNIIQILGW